MLFSLPTFRCPVSHQTQEHPSNSSQLSWDYDRAPRGAPLARYERAEWPFRADHVISLLDVYGVYDEVKRSQLIDLSQTAWKLNQWEPVGSRFDSLLPKDGKGLLPIDPWWLGNATVDQGPGKVVKVSSVVRFA
ncbi:hypothetical protein [Phytohabitans kaempferiae]|uniref:Uncharacterized protein n=1 Tax=Phytohabitans kaempferiae TaxID=1620943 RepID=A0ABV6MDH9_9ACTN